MRVLVGTCGFATSKNTYFKKFNTVEIQETFYNIPSEKTAKKWKEEAPEDFVYTLKAWQGITHPANSPTWKRYKGKRRINLANYGNFMPTKEVFEAWKATADFARILGARMVIFQSPPSFEPSMRNRSNVENFFSSIERYGLKLGWEPRGEWLNEKEILKQIIEKCDLIHVVDPFWDKPVVEQEVRYFRLHGLGRRYNYKYEYTSKDLEKLLKIVFEQSFEEVYVMFNVISMMKAAEEFLKLIRKEEKEL